MLRRIRLEDFRKHRRREIDFGKITAILGPNGAGKSSVLDAIELALYPDQFHTVAHNVRKGAKGSEVRLEVSADGRLITFHTEIRTGGKRLNYAIYYENGGVGNHEEARKEVGLPGSLREFDVLHYIRQGALSTSPKDIATTMRRMLGIDRIKKLLEILRETEKELNDRVKGIKGHLPIIDDHFQGLGIVELGDLERRINRLDREIAEEECESRFLRKRIEREERALEALTLEIERAERRERELEARVSRKRRIQGKIEALKGEIERLEADLAGMSVEIEDGEGLEVVSERKEEVKRDGEAVIRMSERLKSLNGDVEEKRKRIESLRSDLGEILTLLKNWAPGEVRNAREYAVAKREYERTIGAYEEYERLKGRQEEVGRKLVELRKVWVWLKRMEDLKRAIEEKLGRVLSLDEYEGELEDLRREVASLKAEEEHERERFEALRRGEGRCPVCGREIENPQALLKTTEEGLRSLREKLRELSETLKRYEEVKGKVREYHDLASRVREAVEGMDGMNLPANTPLEDLRRAVEEIGKSLKREEEEIGKRLKDLQEAYERHISARRRVEEYGARLPVPLSPKDEEVFASLSEETPKLYEEMRMLEREIGKLEERRREILKDLEEISRKYPEANRDLEEYLKRLEEDLTRKEEYLKKLSEKEAKERELKGLTDEVERLGNPEEDLEKLRKEIKRMREEKEERGRRLGEMKLDLRDRGTTLKDKSEKVRKLRDRLGEWKDLVFLRERVRAMREKVEESQEKFIESRRRAFEMKVAHYFLNIFGHGISYSNLEMDDDLMPILTLHNGEKVSVSYGQRVGNDQIALSGGERTAMYLSYIMALREVVGKERGVAPVLILDEPTTHLDADRREDVWEMLDTLHSKKGIQIIVVTHDTHSFERVLGNRPYVRRINL